MRSLVATPAGAEARVAGAEKRIVGDAPIEEEEEARVAMETRVIGNTQRRQSLQ